MRVLSLEDLTVWRQRCRQQGETVALTNGCFDLVHVGHLRSLQFAADFADNLVVAVNGDDSVRQLKGPGRPICPEGDRAELLAGLRCVSAVVVFQELRLTHVIEGLKPDVYVKGGDYTLETLDAGERAALDAAGTRIEFFPTVEGKSTSAMVGRVNRTGEEAS